ncbi:MAG: SBBP repeat-containing protein [Candidatus Helarchaeota archaeon]
MKNHKIIRKICVLNLILLLFFLFSVIGNEHNSSCEVDNEININARDIHPIYNQEWYKRWGGIYGDTGRGIAIDNNINIYLVGYTDSFSGNNDAFIVKYNSSGFQIWNRTWGGSSDDWALGGVVDQSNYIYFTGVTMSFGAGNKDIFLAKFDSNGTQLWNITWGGVSDDVAGTIVCDDDDNIYLAGYSGNFGSGDARGNLIKFNSSGKQDWNLSWDGISRDVTVDNESNIYLAGYTAVSSAGSNDAYIAKYNLSGVLLWNTTWGGIKWDEGTCIAVDGNNNVYLSGKSHSWSSDPTFSDVFLVKYDSEGNEIWQTLWGGYYNDWVYDAVVDNNGNIYLTGELLTYSFYRGAWDFQLAESFDAFVVKFDSGGNEIGHRIWGGTGIRDSGNGITIDNSGNCYIAGEVWVETEDRGSIPDAFVFKCNLFHSGRAPQFEWLFLVIIIEIVSLIIIELRYYKKSKVLKE